MKKGQSCTHRPGTCLGAATEARGIPVLRGLDIGSLSDVLLMEIGSLAMETGLGSGENSIFNMECEGLVGEPRGIVHEGAVNVKQEYYQGLT